VAELAEARGELGGLGPARVLHRRLVGGELHDVVVDAGPVAVGGDRAPQGAGRAAVVEAGADLLPERLDLVHAGRVHLDDLDEPGHRRLLTRHRRYRRRAAEPTPGPGCRPAPERVDYRRSTGGDSA